MSQVNSDHPIRVYNCRCGNRLWHNPRIRVLTCRCGNVIYDIRGPWEKSKDEGRVGY